MKIPPSPEKAVPAATAVRSEKDRSFLIFAGVVLAAIALGFKSELLDEGQVWALSLGLVVVAAPALLGYLRGTEEFPRIEHYIPVALGAITLAGLAGGHDSAGHPLIAELWKYGLITAAFGGGFVLSARLDYLRLRNAEKRGHIVLQEAILALVLAGAYLVIVTIPFNIILKLLWIFTITFLASYRSFRINGIAIAPRRAFLFALFVGQVVTFLAWAIEALSIYLVVNEGTKAVMLFFAWYINRGLVRHTVEESFTRNVVLEYGAFAVVLIYLFVSSYQPR
ncbi:MAG: hypothetical protein E6J18_13685 [Chloroflexi bacterium]|nr:MAG: hypothetical protein E6J37_02100 [Chloroflexota bacterium]TMC68783.1 MAG: hypothetical protein E6J18_13685 [Chloroflexota bacterium]